MPRIAECPDQPALKRILLGLDDVVEELFQHLESCPECERHMRTIPAVDDIVEAMHDSSRVSDSTDSSLLRSMIPVLKCLRPRDATVTWLSDSDTAATGVTYSFLGPSASEHELGSLGAYRILEVLGAGGMGVVFLAHDDRLNRNIAVKVIKPGLKAKADAVQRFLNEARAVAAVEHDNIVPIYQADEQDGTPFLAMPLLRGESLETQLQRENGPLTVEDVLRIGRDTALGLAVAHEHGLIHRDIKPGNLWLDSAANGRVKILDFGLAASAKSNDGSEAAPEIAGTPAYMAPEQATGKVDGRADLFSLGCVLYRAATGKPAFHAKGTIQTLLSVAKDEPPHPCTVNPQLPAALGKLIVQLLAKRPEARPASAIEVVATLDRMLAPQRSWMSRRGWVLLTGATGIAAGIGLWAWLGETPQPVVAPEPKAPFVGELRNHEMHSGTVTGVALIEHEGNLLAVSAGLDRRVWLWNPAKVEKPTSLRPSRDAFFDVPLLCLAVAHDGKRIVVGGGDRASGEGSRFEIWDLATRKQVPLTRIGGQQGLIQALAFDPTGNHVLDGRSDGLVSVWDIANEVALGGYADRDPKRYNLGIWALAVAKSGKFALAGGGDGSVIVLGLAPITELKTHRDVHPGGVSAVAIFADGRGNVSAGKDGVIQIWDGEGKARQLLGHTKAVNAVSISDDGSRLVSAGEDGTLRVWDVERGNALAELKANAKGIKSVAITSDGRHALSGGADGAVRFWKLPP